MWGSHSGNYEEFWYITPCSLVKANVSEERIAIIFKVEEYVCYTADNTLQVVAFCTLWDSKVHYHVHKTLS
jgi:hypothetical protein